MNVVHPASSTLDVHRLVTGGDWKENCYLVHDSRSGEIAIIDPGDGASRIVDAIAQLDGVVKHILLTHAHHDHVGAVADLSDRYELLALLHPLDRRLLRQAPMYSQVFAGRAQRPVTRTGELQQGDGVALGAHAIVVRHVPGHSPGSVSFLVDTMVFSGDIIFERGIGRTDLPGARAEELYATIDAFCNEVAPATTVYPGHGPSFALGTFAEWWATAARGAATTDEASPTARDADAPAQRPQAGLPL
jgi:Zn-dependent hydrolases, including glyoxylases